MFDIQQHLILFISAKNYETCSSSILTQQCLLKMTSENLRGIQLAYKPNAYGDLDWALLTQVDPATCLLTFSWD